jgi:sugar phosphate isomerase/epimerase
VSELSLSTMWAIGRFQGLTDFFREGKRLGFRRFELNHAVDSAMLDSLSLDKVITSIHEPCPADISTALLKEHNWLISAAQEDERQQGVAAVRRSIDLAHELGAGAVIVHPGRVDMDPEYEATLIRLYQEGKAGGQTYERAKERCAVARDAEARPNMQSVRRSVIELAEYADRNGIQLGLENRYHYYEIPSPDELDELLDLGLGATVGYWHDVGHAQVLQHQGFYSQEEWLRRFAGHMVGVHLHDVVGMTDHLAAGLGQVDWNLVASYLPADVLRTCEFQYTNSPQQIAAGVAWLAALERSEGPSAPDVGMPHAP